MEKGDLVVCELTPSATGKWPHLPQKKVDLAASMRMTESTAYEAPASARNKMSENLHVIERNVVSDTKVEYPMFQEQGFHRA